MVKYYLSVFILSFLLNQVLFAQDISVKASADASAYMVGDYIHYTIQIKADKNLVITGPAVSDTLAGLELISQQNPQKEEKDNKQLITYAYTYSKYDSSDVTVPPVSVYYEVKGDSTESSVNTNQVYFTVRPVKVDTKEDIKDVKEPLRIPLDWKWIAFWIIIASLILATGYYFFRRYQKRKAAYIPEKVVIKVPSHITALNALKVLREKQLWQKGMVKEYHSEITEIIRKYFEERFELPALEMTSGESIEELRLRRGTKMIIEDTRDFLGNADLVKFAKYQPLASVNEEMMRQAESIVNKTKSYAEVTANEVAENVQ